jgi:phosphoribosylformylglycinamidine synthase
VVALVGAAGGGPLGGSAYARRVHGAEGGAVPAPELLREHAVLEVVRRAVRGGLLASARPVGWGGLAVALAEACGALGVAVRVPFAWPREQVLFGEEPGRVLVSLPAERLPALEALAQEHGAPLVRLGVVGGDRLEVQAALSVELDALLLARRAGESGSAGAATAGTLPA